MSNDTRILIYFIFQANRERLEAEKKLAQHEQSLKKLFNPDQLNALKRRSTQGMTWELSTVKKALQLRFSCGTAGYNHLLAQGQPLPSVSTLQKRMKTLPFAAGILRSVFNYMKPKVCIFMMISIIFGFGTCC